MTARIYPLPDKHGDNCDVCGGDGTLQVAVMRLRGNSETPAWLPAVLVRCPLISSVDSLLNALPVSATGGGGAA